ncbi:hypothetical protein GF358_00725 [Candidatus Woesearchaeota archaeon]|nr:hypothetical protein [Candidatus Woesearchaeota archaeon]
MEKKIILIITITVLCLSTLGILFYFLLPSQQIKSCEEINEELYNYVMAIKNQDISYCGNTGNPDFCKAHVMKDISFCNTQENTNYCKAIITENEGLCPAEDWWCKADASKNPSYCNKMPEKEREQCKADITLNEKYYTQENLC